MTDLPFYLAHGAGAGHSNAFLNALGVAISKQMNQNIIPVTFAYMEEQQIKSKKRPPPPFKNLVPEFANNIKNEEACIVAGKSMGGRVATQLSSLSMVKAIVCFGFPFYPAGKPEKNRLSFLDNLQVPCLIIQGTRDQLGSYDWVSQQSLPNNVKVIWVEGADHDFKTLKKQNQSISDTISNLAEITQTWLNLTIYKQSPEFKQYQNTLSN
ncbi:hydrolase [Marinomonas ushuaiensis DSM 15871]|uniref:Hydrolase n=1 Tax=Marinomonas ushuaiensis DSM 15871 TaxID=1122207 RepID=X7E613_9GAMM|nr:alpha/beta family hydrolase [Marinomonas ushuaiensis]ETX11489.1 hydrolase [Marinomonas ushuaiensis DSM 15871]